jgi:Mg-chelatase subunit ChlD
MKLSVLLRPAAILRIAALTLLVPALIGIPRRVDGGIPATLILLDSSLSIGSRGEESFRTGWNFARELSRRFSSEHFGGIALFSRDVRLLSPLGPDPGRGFDEISRALDTGDIAASGETDLGKALLYALDTLPRRGRNSVVLITDGNETLGSARSAADWFGRYRIPVHVFPLSGRDPGQEVFIGKVFGPKTVRTDEGFTLSTVVESTVRTETRIRIYRNGEYYGERSGLLDPGRNVFTFTEALEDPGLYRYTVTAEPSVDGILGNNRAEHFVRATGPSRVLIVTGEEPRRNRLARLLKTQGFTVAVVPPGEMPLNIGEYLPLSAVVLDNIPASALPLQVMEILRLYVRNFGGGLLMTGGDTSFGPGGYYQTPVEEILPVDMDLSSPLEFPVVSITCLVDKSDSMGEEVEPGETKLDLARRAVLEPAEALNDHFSLSVIGFDTEYYRTVPPTPAGELSRIRAGLEGLSSSGGTSLYPSLRAAVTDLKDSDSTIRHIIVLSDGLSEPGDFQDLLEEARRGGITVSTVAVGSESDRTLLGNIARWGGGRDYYTDSMKNVPRIFAEETYIASHEYARDELFIPRIIADHPVVSGLEVPPPELAGFVLTYPKQSAEILMEAFGGHPLLAVRSYGLGRSAAFTSDLSGVWSAEWFSWSEVSRFAAELVRWIERPADAEGTDSISLDRKDRGPSRIVYTRTDPAGEPVDLLSLGLFYTSLPAGREYPPVRMVQTGPGEYTAEIPLPPRDTGLLTITGGEGFPPVVFGIEGKYSPELVPAGTDLATLRRIAGITGGRILDTDDTDPAALLPEADPASASERIRLPFILAALAVFTAECFLRMIRRRIGYPRHTVGSRIGASPRDASAHGVSAPGTGAAPRRLAGQAGSFEDAAVIVNKERLRRTGALRDEKFWFGRQPGTVKDLSLKGKKRY